MGSETPLRSRPPRARRSLGAAVVVASLAALAGEHELAAGPLPPITPQAPSGAPLPGLTPAQLNRFNTGSVAYNTPLLPALGLGPIFNSSNCGNCHSHPFGSSGPTTVTRFGREEAGAFEPLTDLGGPLLQRQTIDADDICVEEVPPEANRTTLRTSFGSMGYGLIEAIDDDDLRAFADSPPRPEISGRVHEVEAFEDPGVPRVGRFGWKAQVATILTFSADAALNEMGMTNRFLPDELDPNGVMPPSLDDPDFCDDVADPEDGPAGGVPGAPHFIDRVTDFQRFLTQPPQTPRSGMTGEAIYDAIGCTACHVARFTTRDDPGLEDAIRNQLIRPYSDFLLHDMGDGADRFPQGTAAATEMRTTPLWGLRIRDPLWHDGRFEGGTFESRVLAAIDEHGLPGSEAIAVTAAWDALAPTEKDQVLAFLRSLGRLEFDPDEDDDVDLDDFVDFAACFAGPQGYAADDACAVHDIDQDGDVDDADFASFLLVYAGPADDCNENGALDLHDILDGVSLDLDGDGSPDECGDCPGDVSADGIVDFDDLLQVLAAWGPCGACAADLDGSGTVEFPDLLLVLAAWGPC